MSNRRKPQKPDPGYVPVMSTIPSVYVNQYEFSIQDGLISVRMGRSNETHIDVTMQVNLFLDMLNKVQEEILKLTNCKSPSTEKDSNQ